MDLLWTDTAVAENKIREIAGMQGYSKFAPKLTQFRESGYTILESAVPSESIDAYIREFDEAALSDMSITVSYGRDVYPIAGQDLRKPLLKILDTHVKLPSARGLFFSEDVRGFLKLLFEEDPLAFQSLHFEVGSTQAIHQDTAYVVTETPNKLAAAWIALEDVQPGTGELIYYPGSHKFGPFMYPDNRKHWKPEVDGDAIHDHHLHWLHETAQELGIEQVSFLPKKGDVLFWHADLAHGGGTIVDSNATRRSLVVHYTAGSVSPVYFQGLPADHPRRQAVPGGYISSMYYDTRATL